MNSPRINPKPGEVWRVNLEPVEGSEQGKKRPVVVMSDDATGRATIRLCAPVIHRKREHAMFFWCAELTPDLNNGLNKESTADTAQTRALDLLRFETLLGEIAPDELEAITSALCLCVGRQAVPLNTAGGGEDLL